MSAGADGAVWRDATADDGGGMAGGVPAKSTQAPKRPWTDEDVAFLRKHYRRRGATWCAAQLGRTVDTTESAAHRRGITVLWTRRELTILRNEWGELGERSLRRKLPGRTMSAISMKARELGLVNPNQGKASMKEAERASGINRRRLARIFAEYGVRLTYRVRTFTRDPSAEHGRYWVFDLDEAMDAVRAWLAAKAARLNRAEAMARMGLSMHHTQQAMRLLASTRPVDGLTAREWLLSPEDVDAAAAMYRAARGGR